jgi:pimeloyl-ACP methyl ester carboxylesterase
MTSETLLQRIDPAAATNTHGYAPVNGLNMYYEIEGAGAPLVYIPPALGHSDLNSFPELAVRHAVIKIDVQGHGRTADVPDRPVSIEQYTEDIAALLKHLGIARADFLGESYGGAAAVMMAVRYPALVGRIVAYGATHGPPETAHDPDMLRFEAPPNAEAHAFAFQREAYKKVAPDPQAWPRMWHKVAHLEWRGFSREALASIAAPVLIILGDRDFVRVEHAIETMKLIPRAELAVVPDAGHFALYSEHEKVVPIIQHFLEKPETRIPVATAGMGYHPGETR